MIGISNSISVGRPSISSPGGSLLLDQFGGDIAAAYSLRKLSTSYSGSAIRVRNLSNAETDIGFDSNGDLDTNAVVAHCGVANGNIVTWYDQSGNGCNATQPLSVSQPFIYETGSMVTANSKPTIKHSGAFFTQLNISNLELVTQPLTFFEIFKDTTTVAISFNKNVFDGASLAAKPATRITSKHQNTPKMPQIVTQHAGGLIETNSTGTPNDTNLHVYTKMINGASTVFRTDQSALTITNTPLADASFGGTHPTAFAQITFEQLTFLSEFIIYNADKTSEFTGIETDMKNYYSTP